ncbi:AAEL014602-PA [Aedes aegypti]|uniref:AAEL014602-PA n=1 Tax=Aedes aegypti TaxID=7159 RepID=Q16FX6_AEDAE|nr:AAEL014602-PA [Aedes aegypti]
MLLIDAAPGLRNLALVIKPPWVRRGQEAQLYCQYEMENAPLYSVKWYRGTLEFYRFSPSENPPGKIFPFTGIKVDNRAVREEALNDGYGAGEHWFKTQPDLSCSVRLW